MLGGIIDEAAERFGDRAAFADQRGDTLTYTDLASRSAALARRFVADGLGRDSVIALTIGSGFDYAIAYLAAARIGAITAGINPSLTDHERDAILERLGADLVIGAPLEPAQFSNTAAPPAGIDDPNQIVAIVFTSGTTGPPKGAIFRNRQLDAICEIDLGPGWRDRWDGGGSMLISTQFAHVGFMTKLPWYLRLGTTMHVLDRWVASEVLALIDRERIATVGAVAPQLALMLRAPEIETVDLSCVRAIIAGGAASPPGLVRAVQERFGADYSIRYSSTESGGVGIATAFGADEDECCYSVGRPRPGVEVAIRDADDVACEPGEVGELCLRSPAVFDGYWNDPEATAATLVDGWLHTGDLATVGEDGLVRLAGRSKEMYIRGGYNVAPAEVEAVLSEHPGVESVAIAARHDEVMGEIGVAVVVPRSDAALLDLAELRAFAGERLARWKLPEDLMVVEELPLTAMQKIDRSALGRLVAVTGTDETAP